MSGHSEKAVEEFISRFYLNRTAAAEAIDAMERVRTVSRGRYLLFRFAGSAVSI